MKGQKKNPPWLEKEDRLLKENIQLKIVELAEIIGRSEASIRQRKYILGLKSNKFPLFTDWCGKPTPLGVGWIALNTIKK